MQPNVRNQKVYVVVESVLESRSNPDEVHEYLRANRFTGQAELKYDADYNQGGVRQIVTREHLPITMKELDDLLSRRSPQNKS